MAKQFNIIMFTNALGLDTSRVGNVHRLPFIQALAEKMQGWGDLLVVTSPASLFVAPLYNPTRVWSFFKKPKLDKRMDNLHVLSPATLLPISLAAFWSPGLTFCRSQLKQQLGDALERLKLWPEMPRVLWVTHPFHMYYSGLAEEDILVYECYDDFISLGPKGFESRIRGLEEELALRSNIILCTADKLYNRLKNLNVNTYSFPNATDFRLFNQAAREGLVLGEEMSKIPKPVIGFMGNLNDWSDYALLSDVMRNKPQWSFVFISEIGSDVRDLVEPLRILPNTYFLGWQDYYRLPAFLKGFDVAIMPYKLNTVTQSVNPNKMYQYMAAGIPIVSTPIREVARFGDIVALAETTSDFCDAIEQAIGQKNSDRTRNGLLMAQRESWDARAQMALNFIAEKLEEKANHSKTSAVL